MVLALTGSLASQVPELSPAAVGGETEQECAAILQAFLNALSTITDYQVTGEHLLAAIDSLRETDDVAIDIDRVDHIGLVIERLMESHAGGSA